MQSIKLQRNVMLYYLFLWNMEELKSLSLMERKQRIDTGVRRFREFDHGSTGIRFFVVYSVSVIAGIASWALHSWMLGLTMLIMSIIILEAFMVKSEEPFIKMMITGKDFQEYM